jgi:hypothetical protein
MARELERVSVIRILVAWTHIVYPQCISLNGCYSFRLLRTYHRRHEKWSVEGIGGFAR